MPPVAPSSPVQAPLSEEQQLQLILQQSQQEYEEQEKIKKAIEKLTQSLLQQEPQQKVEEIAPDEAAIKLRELGIELQEITLQKAYEVLETAIPDVVIQQLHEVTGLDSQEIRALNFKDVLSMLNLM